MKVAVVILNWNGKELLAQFLPSVKANSNGDVEIFIADNASIDESISFVKENYPDIGIIQLTENYGYAGGYNQSLKDLEADVFVLLNSDVEVAPNWLDPVVKRFSSDNNIAAIQPKIKAFKDKESFEYAGAAGGFIDRWGYTFCRGRLFDHLEKDLGQYEEATEIFWASGACLFVRKDAFNEVGGLDDDFFAHMEEIDLCWRIKNRGYSIWYEPNSTIYHVGGATLSNTNPRKTYLNFRNSLFTLVKNTDSNVFIRTVLRMKLDGIAVLRFLLQLKPLYCLAILKAHLSFYMNLGRILKQRKQLPKRSNYYQINSIVWSYFIKKRSKF